LQTSHFADTFLMFVPVIFALIWIGTSYMLALVSGWMELAKVYGSDKLCTGKVWRFQSMRLWPANYNGCVNIGTDFDGVCLYLFFLFRAGHRPLFISWSDITAVRKVKRIRIFNYVELSLAQCPSVKICIDERLAARLVEASNGKVSIPGIGK